MWDTVQGLRRSYLQIPREIWTPSWVVWIAAPNTLCVASHAIWPNVLPGCSSRFSPFSILLATFSLFDRPVCRMYFASSRHHFDQRYHCQLLFNWKVQSPSQHKGFGSLWGKNRRIQNSESSCPIAEISELPTFSSCSALIKNYFNHSIHFFQPRSLLPWMFHCLLCVLWAIRPPNCGQATTQIKQRAVFFFWLGGGAFPQISGSFFPFDPGAKVPLGRGDQGSEKIFIFLSQYFPPK